MTAFDNTNCIKLSRYDFKTTKLNIPLTKRMKKNYGYEIDARVSLLETFNKLFYRTIPKVYI